MIFARRVKVVSLALCALVAYTFVAGATYQYMMDDCTDCVRRKVIEVAVIWPLALPIWAASDALLVVAKYGAEWEATR